jgi:hypothetical protein
MLARFGAHVTSVQPVTSSADPWNAVVFGLHAHRGKLSLPLNQISTEGRAALAGCGGRLVVEVSAGVKLRRLAAQIDTFDCSMSRAFSMAMTLWSANMRATSSVLLSNGRTVWR